MCRQRHGKANTLSFTTLYYKCDRKGASTDMSNGSLPFLGSIKKLIDSCTTSKKLNDIGLSDLVWKKKCENFTSCILLLTIGILIMFWEAHS
jgi:hypothetical protein